MSRKLSLGLSSYDLPRDSRNVYSGIVYHASHIDINCPGSLSLASCLVRSSSALSCGNPFYPYNISDTEHINNTYTIHATVSKYERRR